MVIDQWQIHIQTFHQHLTDKVILHPFSKTRGVSERNTHIDASPKSHLSFQEKAPPAHVSSEMPFLYFPQGVGFEPT
ncbi:MAG: hypothetical protein IIU08_00645, partial [Clostridia bacterium]|nr:hypothetical protein [Clostridia bacterium]